MLFCLRIDRRIIATLTTILSVILVIKWARMTVPEKAEDLSILLLFANDQSRPSFPPSKQRCSLEPASTTGLHDTSSSLCTGFPTDAHPRVHIVLKTGASERGKTRMVLSTLLACSPSVTVVSDMEDEIKGHRVIDILADLPATYANDNPAWSVYESQKEATSKGEQVYKTAEGWKLDRFKFLPMIEKAFEMEPDAEWYFFVEADTYFFWDTLYRLLGQLDASERHYVGSAAPGSNHTFFAYGGAGFVMSGRLLHDLLYERTEPLSVKYEQWAKDDCCGDALTAYVLREELDLRIQNGYPTLSGEALSALEVGADTWCVPLLTLHRIPPELMEQLWRWERCRPYDERPIRLSTVLDFTLSPILRHGSTQTRWDNYSNRRVNSWSSAHLSASKCARYCAVDEACLQWTYSKDECRTADKVRQGQSVDDNVVSGWDVLKLEALGYQIDGDSSDICGT